MHRILWTKHAIQRQADWEKKLGITKEEVEEILQGSRHVVEGDLEVRVAQSLRSNGIVRIPFVESKGTRKVITVYWTSKVEKYWKEK